MTTKYDALTAASLLRARSEFFLGHQAFQDGHHLAEDSCGRPVFVLRTTGQTRSASSHAIEGYRSARSWGFGKVPADEKEVAAAEYVEELKRELSEASALGLF